MKERPILFSAPMVRAILSGTKTQTRRVVKPQPRWIADPHVPFKTEDCNPRGIICCPYGNPGDRLWVRETWQGPLLDSEEHEAQFRDDGPEAFRKPGFCVYRATDTLEAIDEDGNDLGWRPSIHMPRWASRILLEVTDVRVERLQCISEADCVAEGCSGGHGSIPGYGYSATPSEHYRSLWESINGAGSWGDNPWVWVISFMVIK